MRRRFAATTSPARRSGSNAPQDAHLPRGVHGDVPSAHRHLHREPRRGRGAPRGDRPRGREDRASTRATPSSAAATRSSSRRLARDRIAHVHLKDVEPRILDRLRSRELTVEQAWEQGLFCPLGDGVVDFAAVLAELDGYSGWAVVEQDRIAVRAADIEAGARRRSAQPCGRSHVPRRHYASVLYSSPLSALQPSSPLTPFDPLAERRSRRRRS